MAGGRGRGVGGRWRHLLPVALWLRMRSVTRENSAASTVPSPFRSNILKAIWGGFAVGGFAMGGFAMGGVGWRTWKCLREVERTVSRKM